MKIKGVNLQSLWKRWPRAGC